MSPFCKKSCCSNTMCKTTFTISVPVSPLPTFASSANICTFNLLLSLFTLCPSSGLRIIGEIQIQDRDIFKLKQQVLVFVSMIPCKLSNESCKRKELIWFHVEDREGIMLTTLLRVLILSLNLLILNWLSTKDWNTSNHEKGCTALIWLGFFPWSRVCAEFNYSLMVRELMSWAKRII